MRSDAMKKYLNSAAPPKVWRGYGRPIEDKAQEDLTHLGEMEDKAKAEQDTADQDSAESAEGNPPVKKAKAKRKSKGSIKGEKPPMNYGSID